MAPESTSGIDMMRSRMERARRRPPAPRRPSVSAAPGEEPEQASEAQSPRAEGQGGPARRVRTAPRAPRPAGETQRVRLSPDLPSVNLAIRVRKPLDDRLADAIHRLRGAGVRSSKVELIEMLLWELPAGRDDELRERLRRFREWAPRGASAPLGPGS